MKEDALLIDETLAGNNAAFGQLIQKYQDRLFNTLVHVIGCHEEAEDVAQETFVQAFLKLNTFQRRASVYTWMYRIAFNLWISRLRRKRPELSVEQSRETAGAEPADDSEEPLERLEREERARQIHLAISELSDEHRSILVLREMEGCCYETISEILDLPVGTVRSRLHRARIHLKQRLKTVLSEKTET
ncbi:MAG: sigma-70 family RNA polymerase sigma factor [Pirellulaceae bacterium]|nr:sigma-70 family RNA polymerase sigma factor [Pirellulaceae bacterium]